MHSLDDSALMNITSRPHAVMARGRGSWLWDESQRRYLDFVQGWAVNCLGHAPSEIGEALSAQARELLTPSPAFHNRPQLELAGALRRLTGLERVFFCSTGAEANEGAIKLARKWGRCRRGGAFEIITTRGGFHGRTLATMAASGKPGWDAIFPPPVEGFRKVEFGDLAAVEGAIGPSTAAVMVEPIQGEAGVVVPPDGYLRGLRELTRERGLLLVLDEVQTGMGRTGPLFAHQREGIRPDILTLGKGLGGGVPLAALLGREAVCCFEPGDQGGTYNGNPLVTAVGLAVVGALTRPGFLEAAQEVGRYLAERLAAIARRFSGCSLRGRGLLLALQLPAPVARNVAATCFERGLLLNAPGPALLRFMPALTLERAEVEAMSAILEPALEEHLSPYLQEIPSHGEVAPPRR